MVGKDTQRKPNNANHAIVSRYDHLQIPNTDFDVGPTHGKRLIGRTSYDLKQSGTLCPL